MRRWFPAIAASLVFHLLLLLLPASVPEASEPPASLRLVLRHLAPPRRETPENRGESAETLLLPAAQREEAVAAVPKETSVPPPAVEKKTPPQKSVGKKIPSPPKEVSVKKTSAPVSFPPSPATKDSLWAEKPAATGGEKSKPEPIITGRRTEPVDGESLSIVKRIVPIYPLFSRKRGEEGKAVILVTIQSGRVTDAKVERSSGSTRLDAVALRASRLWIFSEKITARARIPFLFQLEK